MLRKHASTLVLCTLGVLVLLGIAVPMAMAEGPAPAPDACTANKNWLVKGNCGMVAGTNFVGTTDNQALVIKTNNAERARVLANGNVGIGTNNPANRLTVAGLIQSTSGGFKFPDGTTQATAVSGGNFVLKSGSTMTGALVLPLNGLTAGTNQLVLKSGNVGVGTTSPSAVLSIVKSSATEPNVQGIATGLKVGTPSGTIPFAVRQNAAESSTPALAYFETSNGAIGSFGANVGNFVVSGATGKGLTLNVNNTATGIKIGSNGNVGIGTSPSNSKVEIAAQDGLAITGYQPFLTLRDTNAGNTRSILAGGNGDFGFYPNSFIGGYPAMILKNGTGNLGIGTPSPSALLSVVKGGVEPTVQNVSTALKVGTAAGTIPLALRQNATSSGTPTLLFLETHDGDIGGIGESSAQGMAINTAIGRQLNINVNGTTNAMNIDTSGKISIGSAFASSQLYVKNSINGIDPFRVDASNGTTSFGVTASGFVAVRLLGPSGGGQVCLFSGVLAQCASAAEYVPSIDAGFGFPETADLVSIAPEVVNPYEDEHGPFVVTKTTKACDNNLLGYIVNPEKGASGVKLNDHYLPLAIYGYFPAKVTMENGAIHRGDPLTSSSKAGYAMKATGACKIIGYALEDANSEGMIQVFANHGDSSASAVASLSGKVDALTQENDALKQDNATLKAELAAIDARLSALENAAPKVQASDASGNANAQ